MSEENNANHKFIMSSSKRNFFKLSTLVILFLLIISQFFGAIIQHKIVPEALSIGIAFVCILYLWIAEQIDISRLHQTNIQLLKARDDLRVSHVETILSLVLSQEAKDAYTYGHSERVKQCSMVLARELGLSPDEVEIIARGAKLHDIGKIGIRDDVLFCDGDLTKEQYDIIKTHPVKGVAIIEPLKFLAREKLIIRHHHEKCDGTGYPDGLKKQNIPLGARIVCVADAFDAMKTRRPYKQPLSKKDIVHEFEKNMGIQFDPKVAEVLIKNIDRFYG